MPSINAFPKVLFSLNCFIIAIPIGSIITEVAVFEIHIDKNAVANINPSITLRASIPIKEIILIAILLCKFHFSIPIAIKNPPKYRKTNLCP